MREVLDRAGVDRSTFYVHYRDKDDLLLSELEQGLEMWTIAPWSTLAGSKHSSSLRKAASRAGSTNVSSNQPTSASRLRWLAENGVIH